jgi:hypothetical protein
LENNEVSSQILYKGFLNEGQIFSPVACFELDALDSEASLLPECAGSFF